MKKKFHAKFGKRNIKILNDNKIFDKLKLKIKIVKILRFFRWSDYSEQ